MREIVTLPAFEAWLDGLKDRRACAIVAKRIDRMRVGNFGDVRTVGEGVSEARIHFGPGYRVYFALAGATVVVLLCGGSKRTQATDIRRALQQWSQFKR